MTHFTFILKNNKHAINILTGYKGYTARLKKKMKKTAMR
ncbi:hypothetical protein M976_01876 [Buttiauxella ferragutiae ATCC 51602]|uniref:Uncharacterized protein n=1 Tax=Buttiauxella ferragutiae ATCC 51602 TaxID=1354252 RepID=A0ABX2W9C6_9ENTR|nr:hypothetical protein M976_01876 [Buttiauxella ferragutiae ATCC 51602]